MFSLHRPHLHPSEPTVLNLHLRLHRAKNLSAANFARNTSDPYIILTLKNDTHKRQWRSRILHNTLDPLWNESVIMKRVSIDDLIRLEVWDWNRVVPDVRIGVGELGVAEGLEVGREKLVEGLDSGVGVGNGEGLDVYEVKGNWRERWGERMGKEETGGSGVEGCMGTWVKLDKQGEVLVSVREMGVDEDDNEVVESNGGVLYRRYVNHKFLGRLSENVRGVFERIPGVFLLGKLLMPVTALLTPLGTKGQFPTYKFNMRFVREVFEDKREHWNEKYINARMIFGPVHYPVRVMISMQHALLYGGGIRGLPFVASARVELRQETGVIATGSEFVKLFNGGVRHEKSRMFTYVLMEDKLYCCETGAEFFADQRSKHAMHCNCAERVVYAGEFHFRDSQRGDASRVTLVLDNNSGTYAPSKDNLELLGRVFALNFPGLNIELLDFKSDKLKRYKEEMKTNGIV